VNTRGRNHAQVLMDALGDPRKAERLLESLRTLRRSLVHTRSVANGLDFLLAGPEEEIRTALRTLGELDRLGGCMLGVDYVRLEGYFLLRVVGTAECQDLILSYLEEPATKKN
jgi:hypothetical protein